VYGDLAFGLREFVLIGYHNQRSADKKSYNHTFNKETSSKRVVVEWTSGDLKANWAIFNVPDKVKIRKPPVGKIVRRARCSSRNARTARTRRDSTFTSTHQRLSSISALRALLTEFIYAALTDETCSDES